MPVRSTTPARAPTGNGTGGLWLCRTLLIPEPCQPGTQVIIPGLQQRSGTKFGCHEAEAEVAAPEAHLPLTLFEREAELRQLA